MVYSPNKVVACVKVDGKVLREEGNTVTLPFGSEYSVLIKNLNATRIKVKVSIDGTEATESVWLVVDANSSMELERFIRNGNLSAGNRFKFIERTEAIEEHRGIKADDGLIRIEYQVEKRRVEVDEIIHHTKHIYDDYDLPYHPWRPSPRWESRTLGDNMKSLRSRVHSSASAGPSRRLTKSAERSFSGSDAIESDSLNCSASLSDQGITVPGPESNQKFTWTSGFET